MPTCCPISTRTVSNRRPVDALTGPPRDDELLPLADLRDVEPERVPYVGTVQLQLSRTDGRIVAWAAGHNLRGEYHEDVLERVRSLDGGAIEWDERATMKIPAAAGLDPVRSGLERPRLVGGSG